MSSIPSFRSVGTYTHGTGSLSVPMPSGFQADDLLVLFVESENQDITTPAGWTQIDVAQGSGTAAADTSVRLEVFYKIATGSEGNVTVADSGDHTSAYIAAFSGVDTSSPINVATGSTASSSTSVTFPSVTTTVNNCLIVNAIAGSQDTTTAQLSGWTNASLSSVTERADAYTTDAGGGGISFATGGLATAGSTGATTATAANATLQAMTTFAIQPQVNFKVIVDTGTFLLRTTGTDLYTSTETRPVIIENFESEFPSSLLDWTVVSGYGGFKTSDYNVTEGASAWVILAPVSTSTTGEFKASAVDISSFETIAIDYDLYTVPTNGQAFLEITDGETSNTYSVPFAAAGTTGKGTCTVDIWSAISDPDNPITSLDNVTIGIYMSDLVSATPHQMTVVVDNLRGIPYKTSLEGLNVMETNTEYSPTVYKSENLVWFMEEQAGGAGGWGLLDSSAGVPGFPTEGTGFWQVSFVGGDAGDYHTLTSIPMDFTNIAAVKIDTYSSDTGSDVQNHGFIELDDGSTISTIVATNGTFETLTIRLSDILSSDPSFDLENVRIRIGIRNDNTAPPGIYDQYFDNLRFLAPGAGISMSVDTGNFTLTGQTVSLRRTWKMVASAGSFALTGQAVALRRALKIAPSTGTFALTGVNAGLLKGRTIQPATGNFTLTGIDAGSHRTYVAGITTGTFALTGQTVGLKKGFKLAANNATFTLTGNNAGLRVGKVMSVTKGTFILTGIATGQGYVRVPSSTWTFTSYAPTVRAITINKVLPSVKNFMLSAYSPAFYTGANIIVPLTEFTMSPGANYTLIQIIDTCSGEAIPLSHMQDSKKLRADAYVDLFQIVLKNDQGILYLKKNKTVDWQGNTYTGTLIQISGVGAYADDQVSRPSLSILNPEGVFTSLVDKGILNNARVYRIRVLLDDLRNDRPVFRRSQWRVTRVSGITEPFINLELRDMLDGQNFLTPGRMFIPPDFPTVSLN